MFSEKKNLGFLSKSLSKKNIKYLRDLSGGDGEFILISIKDHGKYGIHGNKAIYEEIVQFIHCKRLYFSWMAKRFSIKQNISLDQPKKSMNSNDFWTKSFVHISFNLNAEKHLYHTSYLPPTFLLILEKNRIITKWILFSMHPHVTMEVYFIVGTYIFQWMSGAERRSKHWKPVFDANEIKIEISIENVHLIEMNAFCILMLNRPHRMIIWIFRNSAQKSTRVFITHIWINVVREHWTWCCVCVCVWRCHAYCIS